MALISKEYSWYLITYIINTLAIPKKKTWCCFVRLTPYLSRKISIVSPESFGQLLIIFSASYCIICIKPFRHSTRHLFLLLHQSCHGDARLPVQYHYIYIVRLCSLQQSLRSDVLWQNRYRGIYIVLWYLLFHLYLLPNTNSQIPQNHYLQYTHSLLVQTVDARSTYLFHRTHSFLFLLIVLHAQMLVYSVLLPYIHLLSSQLFQH